MGKILSISNQKGGTSKSSSAVNLGAALKMKGKKVLIVDLDPQGDASTYLGYEEESSDTVSQMIERFVRGENVDLHEIIQISEKNGGVEYIPADISLTGAEMYLVNLKGAAEEYGLSRTSIARLLRINKLSDELKAMVDEGNIKIRPAVELSYISKEMQEQLVKAMSEQEVSIIDMKMAKQLREIASSYANPSEEIITEVLCGTYGEDAKPKEAGEKVTISKATYSRYLGGYSKKEANLIIEKALAYYFENNEEETA